MISYELQRDLAYSSGLTRRAMEEAERLYARAASELGGNNPIAELLFTYASLLGAVYDLSKSIGDRQEFKDGPVENAGSTLVLL